MYAVEQYIDGEWRELWSYETKEEAENWVKAINDENRLLTHVTGYEHSGEYRIRKTY